jgi:3-deoxy-D-manno-octulosonic-acid transferase
MWMLYNILFSIGYVLMLPHFLLRMRRRGGYRRDFGERFGRYAPGKMLALSGGGRIWIHAVSVGEANLALALLDTLLAQDPSLQFVISTTTSTGHALLENRKRPEDVLIYYPADFPWIVRRVCRCIQPRAMILLECELWPNLLRRLSRQQIPVWVVNGRISERSYRGYRKVRLFFRRTADLVTTFLVQTESDAARLRDLGAARVQVMGSAKYDLRVPGQEECERARQVVAQAGMRSDGLFWVMGSSWPGEEALLLEVLVSLREKYPLLQAVLVPRHAERGDEVEELLRGKGLPYVRRTRMPEAPLLEPPVLLLADTTGELAGYYMLADIVFVGKSLAGNHGGQNPVEPAALGKAILTGTHMENFPSVMEDLLQAQAIRVVSDYKALAEATGELLADPGQRAAMGARAAAVVASRRGAMSRSAGMILEQIVSSQR